MDPYEFKSEEKTQLIPAHEQIPQSKPDKEDSEH